MRSAARAASAYRPGAGAWLALPLALFLLAGLVVPLAALVVTPLALDPGAFARVALHAGRYRTALVNSLGLSALAAVAATALALLPAWILARESFMGRGVVRALVSLPLSFSGVLVGFLMITLLGRTGVIPALLALLTGQPLLSGAAYGLGGLFVAYLYFEVPRAVMTLEAAFRRFPTELDDAARTLGAGPWRRLVRVILPVAAPSIRSALAVTFSASMGSFGVALLLARRFSVAPLEVYTELTGFSHEAVAGALCLVLAGLTLLVDRALTGGRR